MHLFCSHRLHCYPQAEPPGDGQGYRLVAARARRISPGNAAAIRRCSSPSCRLRAWPSSWRPSISASTTRCSRGSSSPASAATYTSIWPSGTTWASPSAPPSSNSISATIPTAYVSTWVVAERLSAWCGPASAATPTAYRQRQRASCGSSTHGYADIGGLVCSQPGPRTVSICFLVSLPGSRLSVVCPKVITYGVSSMSSFVLRYHT